jgi:hypothetical protein
MRSGVVGAVALLACGSPMPTPDVGSYYLSNERQFSGNSSLLAGALTSVTPLTVRGGDGAADARTMTLGVSLDYVIVLSPCGYPAHPGAMLADTLGPPGSGLTDLTYDESTGGLTSATWVATAGTWSAVAQGQGRFHLSLQGTLGPAAGKPGGAAGTADVTGTLDLDLHCGI